MKAITSQEADLFKAANADADSADYLTRTQGIAAMFRLAEIGRTHVRHWAGQWLRTHYRARPNPHRSTMEPSRATPPAPGCLSR